MSKILKNMVKFMLAPMIKNQMILPFPGAELTMATTAISAGLARRASASTPRGEGHAPSLYAPLSDPMQDFGTTGGEQ